MGIGVSYTGYDGRTRNFQADAPSDLARMMPKSAARGDMSAMFPRVAPRRMDTSVNVPKQDPIDGQLVGVSGNDSVRPDGQQRSVGSRGGWRIPVSRTEMEVKPSLVMNCNEVTLVKLEYDLIMSEAGYVKGRTTEREVWKKSFFVLADGSAAENSAGQYGCRLFYSGVSSDPVHPIPLYFAFGSDENLNTYNSQSGQFGCNYDSSGNVLEDPPVKVVAIESGAIPT